MDNGWDASAAAWIADMGESGDFSRAYVLDAPMLARVEASGARTALDVGCGEGRFCRMLRARGIAATGVEPAAALLAAARARDPEATMPKDAPRRFRFRPSGSISSSAT